MATDLRTKRLAGVPRVASSRALRARRHLFTVYFLEAKLTSASELYGVLGLSTTMLFYLFLIGRGVVWGAELNAVVWEVRHPSPVGTQESTA